MNHISTKHTTIKSLTKIVGIVQFDIMDSRGVKEVKIFFLILKTIMKCLESIIIKIWSNNFKIMRANSGGGGGVWPSWSKANFFKLYFITSLI